MSDAPPPPDASTTTSIEATTTSEQSNEGGFGSPVRSPDEFPEDAADAFSGTVRLADNGCWTALFDGSAYLVVFPDGFVGSAVDGTVLTGGDGTEVRDGFAFDGAGSIWWPSDVPGGIDGKWGNYAAFCAMENQEFVVLESIEPSFDPSALSSDELADVLAQAQFTADWGCGSGFAISTPDQRVGLTIYGPPDGAGPVSLPDSAWTAQITIGKHLSANHCDDTVLPWRVTPTVVATWPVVEGSLVYADPAEVTADCSSPEPVEAELLNGVVDTPLGEVGLPDIHLTNDAYNCFAG